MENNNIQLPSPSINQKITPSEIVLLNASHFAAPAKRKRPIILGFILSIFLILISYIFYLQIINIKTGWLSKNWPTVEGQITHSEIATQEGDKEEVYRADIQYQFLIGAKRYKGNEIYIGSSGEFSSDLEGAKSNLTMYPIGKTVKIFYRPSNPNVSVLKSGVHASTFLLIGILLLFFVLMAILLTNTLKLIFRKN